MHSVIIDAVLFSTFPAADSTGAHRVDCETLSTQTRMELLVQHLKNLEGLVDGNGDFLDYTEWYEVGINDDDEVVGIDIGMLEGRYGTICFEWMPETTKAYYMSLARARGTIDTRRLPRELEELDLNSNEINGTFDIRGLPVDLCIVKVSSNKLEGTLDLAGLPTKMKKFDAAFNLLTGSIDLRSLPITLKSLLLSFNKFGGELEIPSFPPKLTLLALNNNLFEQKTLRLPPLPDNINIFNFRNDTIEEAFFATGERILKNHPNVRA